MDLKINSPRDIITHVTLMIELLDNINALTITPN